MHTECQNFKNIAVKLEEREFCDMCSLFVRALEVGFSDRTYHDLIQSLKPAYR